MANDKPPTSTEIRDGIASLARSIASSEGDGPVLLVGILTSGLPLAQRLASAIGPRASFGGIDIGLYRDDAHLRIPEIIGSDIPFDLNDAHVVLVDDVISSGRTVRAAMDHLMDYGRPSLVRLAVLIDRGGRELPIQPDFCAFRLGLDADRKIKVRISSDASEADSVRIVRPVPAT